MHEQEIEIYRTTRPKCLVLFLCSFHIVGDELAPPQNLFVWVSQTDIGSHHQDKTFRFRFLEGIGTRLICIIIKWSDVNIYYKKIWCHRNHLYNQHAYVFILKPRLKFKNFIRQNMNNIHLYYVLKSLYINRHVYIYLISIFNIKATLVWVWKEAKLDFVYFYRKFRYEQMKC